MSTPTLDRALVDRLQPVLRARVRRFTRRRPDRRIGIEDEDDLVQSAWLRLVGDDGRRLRAFDPARGVTLEGYVGVVTERLLIDRLRGRQARRDEAALDHLCEREACSPEAQALDREALAGLWAHLEATLPERGVQVARLLHHEQRSADEAARALGVTKQVVANWKHRIKRAARAHLDHASA